MKKYKSKKNELVVPERWQWVAEYDSGETIYQFNDKEETFTSITELDLDKVVRFGMVSKDKKMIIEVNPKEMQIFHYYLNFGRLNNNHAEITDKIYVFGFKHRGSSNAVYNFILPNDQIIIKNNQYVRSN